MQKIFKLSCLVFVVSTGLVSIAGCSKKTSEPENSAIENQLASNQSQSALGPDSQIHTAHPAKWPKLTSPFKQNSEQEKKISDLIAGMTVEQKIAQMIQPEIRAVSYEDMRKYGFGSYLNGGGAFPNNDKHASVDDWLAMADAYYEASIDDSVDGQTIPTMWGTDAVHGHNNVIGATIFPHNIGLGATRNPELIKQIGAITAAEVRATGIEWIFAPTVAVVRDDRWGRTYEGYSEDPEIVRGYASAMVNGLQGAAGNNILAGEGAIATAKHFLGDGGTHEGDDQGNNLSSEEELRDIHAPGYFSSIEAGVHTVMASFNSWHGKKMHGNKSLLTDVLKGQLGFDGLVVGDWDGHAQIKGCSKESCPQAILAGVDIIMVPNEWRELYENTVRQVNSGEIPMARIDDAVRRILRVKMRAGLFDGKKPSERKLSGRAELVGAAKHREVARQAVRESLVLLKNKKGLLPLDRKLNVLVAGDGADSIGKAAGGWSVTWQGTGTVNEDFPGGTSIYRGIQKLVQDAGGAAELSVGGAYSKKPDVAIVVYGENPYAEGEGDISNLQYQRGSKADLAILQKLKADGIPVVSVFLTGRPLWVNKELNASDAFVVAWLPGSEGQGVADVLFKKDDGGVNFDFKGRLSFSWPKYDTQMVLNRNDEEYDPLFPYGFGLTYKDVDKLTGELSEEAEEGAMHAADKVFDIFKSRPRNDLVLYLGDPSAWDVVVNQSIMTTKGSDNLVLKAINWKVQEDARQAIFSGKDMAVVYIAPLGGTQVNYSDFLKQKAAMRFDYRLDAYPTSWVELKVDCGFPCSGKLDIKERLMKDVLGEWKSLTVDLACFEKEGTNFVEVSSPWVLMTNGELSLSFANIEYVPNAAKDADISCQ
ncbi:Beta-glucosidase BoGH3B [Thalassocella blandensis]|nr:Beta-glucosidase BoGH3B [Thalassocella blandensis]